MIMVIFGAGASYDSAPSYRPKSNPNLAARPPLAAELFQPRFTTWVDRFPKCKAIVHYLQSISEGNTVEHELEKLQGEENTDRERRRQLASIRHYLQAVIWDCEYQWEGFTKAGTNYIILLDQLRRVRENDQVLLVTFNYDRLIEKALPSVGLSIGELHEYVQSDAFKLFKLHGSVNWAREIDNHVVDIRERNLWEVAYELINVAPDLNISHRFRIVDSVPIGKVDDIPLCPAIALPVETKSNFECPSDHLNCLCEHLGKVTKVVTIGWAAQEQHFLELLKKHLTEDISIYAVAAGKQDAEGVLQRIKAAGICVKDAEAAEGGFTQCTVKREFERFLR
jgi:hypothetical protein